MAVGRLVVAPPGQTFREALQSLAAKGGGGVVAAEGDEGRVMKTAELLDALRREGDQPLTEVIARGVRAAETIEKTEPPRSLADNLAALATVTSADQAVELRTSVTMADELVDFGCSPGT